MTTTTDPLDFARPEVRTAKVELTQAQQLLDALEERVRNGDPGVQPAELADAGQVVGFARLRVDAARRAAKRREHEERAAEYREAAALARAVDTAADQVVVDAFTDAVTALARLWGAADARSRQVRSVASRAANAVETADRYGERDELRAAGIHNAGSAGAFGDATVTVIPRAGDGYRVTDVAPNNVLAAALGRAAQVTGAYLSEAAPEAALTSAARVFPDVATATPAEGTTDGDDA